MRRQSNDRLVSFEAFVKDWAVQNGCQGQCLVAPAHSVGHKIVIVAAGACEWLEFPIGPKPASEDERDKIAKWLRTVLKK
jgi:hypothetical protein